MEYRLVTFTCSLPSWPPGKSRLGRRFREGRKVHSRDPGTFFLPAPHLLEGDVTPKASLAGRPLDERPRGGGREGAPSRPGPSPSPQADLPRRALLFLGFRLVFPSPGSLFSSIAIENARETTVTLRRLPGQQILGARTPCFRRRLRFGRPRSGAIPGGWRAWEAPFRRTQGASPVGGEGPVGPKGGVPTRSRAVWRPRLRRVRSAFHGARVPNLLSGQRHGGFPCVLMQSTKRAPRDDEDSLISTVSRCLPRSPQKNNCNYLPGLGEIIDIIFK